MNFVAVLTALTLATGVAASHGAHGSPPTILVSLDAEPLTRLAASELRRYMHEAHQHPTRATIARVDAETLLIASSSAVSVPTVLVTTVAEAAELCAPLGGCAAPTGANGYRLSTPREGLIAIVGTDASHALYGAYALLEAAGCTFTSAGPTVPARRVHISSDTFSTDAAPVFTTRGLQPFHDFAEGPDWWSEDETKRVMETIVSMKGNLIGFHTYPLLEPAVWVGLAGDVLPGGNVTATLSTYSTRWATTNEPDRAWGYNSLNTSSLGFGASQIFEDECFGHPTVSGDPLLCPMPTTPEDNTELFNRVGMYWKASFAYAKALGVQTVLGTEIPLSMPSVGPPAPPPGATLPLQLWYSASRNDHFITTTDCDECDDLYTLLGVTGWVYAHNESGSTPLCTYAAALSNGQIDNTLTVCDGSNTGVRIEGYAPAAGTPGTAPLTQFVSASSGHHWAADASWTSAATAAGFSPKGIIAPIFTSGPPIPAPSNATSFYAGIFTRLEALLGSNLTYYWGWTPESWEWDRVNINDPKIQKAVQDTRDMQSAWEDVQPSFALASCGWTVGPLGARWYYDTVLPPSWAITSIDMDVGNTPVDPAYANITHRTSANKWAIPWAEDDPGLTAPELWVNRSLSHARDAASYGVGGLLSIHWRTRMTSPQIGSAHAVAWDLSLTTDAYWASWTAGQFGDATVASAAASIFANSADSYNLPRPVDWTGGPGGMAPGGDKCGFAATYAWVDALVALRPALLAAITGGTATLAHLERFDYWAGQFVYMRSIAAFECEWVSYDAVISRVQKITDPAARQAAARADGIAARVALMSNASAMVQNLLATVSTIEGSGTTYNVLSHSAWAAIGPAPTALLEGLTGEPLPTNALPPPSYSAGRAPQARVQVIRTILGADEPLRIRAIVLSNAEAQAPTAVTLFYAPAGSSTWTSMPLTQAVTVGGVERFVFTGELPPQADDFSWYIRADLPAGGPYTEGLGIPAGTVVAADGSVSCFVPPGGADAPQSVVIMPA